MSFIFPDFMPSGNIPALANDFCGAVHNLTRPDENGTLRFISDEEGDGGKAREVMENMVLKPSEMTTDRLIRKIDRLIDRRDVTAALDLAFKALSHVKLDTEAYNKVLSLAEEGVACLKSSGQDALLKSYEWQLAAFSIPYDVQAGKPLTKIAPDRQFQLKPAA